MTFRIQSKRLKGKGDVYRIPLNELSKIVQHLYHVIYKQFLSNLRNKSNFVKFLLSEFEKWFSRDISKTKVYLGLHDGKTHHITYRENNAIGSLRSDHEEADSRIFVYGHDICKNYSHITRMISNSPDTDVAIIACYQAHNNALNMFSEIWFETGTNSNLRYIPIHEIANDLGATISNILPLFHCLTGCDSTASFCGIGKKKSFTILKQKMHNLLFLNGLGDDPYILKVITLRMLCNLYVGCTI